MARLNLNLLCIGVLIRNTESFRSAGGLGKSSSIREQTGGARSWGIIFAFDDADVSFEGDTGIGSFVDNDTGGEVLVPIPVAPELPKKKAAKRKTKASATATTEASVTATTEAPPAVVTAAATETAIAPTTIPPPTAAPDAPVKVPSKIYYRAKEDNEIYAVSSISIDDTVVTLKDLKRILVDANEWSESSRVIFYNGDERLAFTTQLNECLLDNAAVNPLSVTVLTAVNTITEVTQEVVQPREDVQPVVDEVVNSISLYQAPVPENTENMAIQNTVNSAALPIAPENMAIQSAINNAALVQNIIAPGPQAPMMPGPKTGRGAVVDMYSDMPAQSSEWANRMPIDTPELRQIQQASYPPPPPRPPVEETGRFWMNKISLDLGVILVAKVMKALERSQFLVLAAPGGYGKTSLLQLLERVYEKQGKCVVRFRILQDTDVYHQFQTSSGIDLKNAYIHDLRPNYQKVILIDDAHKVYDTPGFWEVLLKKFPTWCFAWDYTIILAVTLPVAQSSPIIELLGDPSIPHLGPKDFVPDQ